MALVFGKCSKFCSDWSPPSEFFDYGLFIPADEHYEIPDILPPQSPSEGSSSPSQSAGGDEAAALEEMEQKKDEIKEKFLELTGGADCADHKTAATLARRMGYAPSQDDIKKLHERFGDNVTFDDFKNFITESVHVEDTPSHLAKFFQHFDTQGTGKLAKKQIKNILQNFGDALSDQEVDALFKASGQTGDSVDYNALVQSLLQKA